MGGGGGYQINPSLSFASSSGSNLTAPSSFHGGGGSTVISFGGSASAPSSSPAVLAIGFLIVGGALIAAWIVRGGKNG